MRKRSHSGGVQVAGTAGFIDITVSVGAALRRMLRTAPASSIHIFFYGSGNKQNAGEIPIAKVKSSTTTEKEIHD